MMEQSASEHTQKQSHGLLKSSSKPNLKQGQLENDHLTVKLDRNSAARPLLYKTNAKQLNQTMQRLADIIQDSDDTHTQSTKGKLPVEAAYSVMKRITEAAGEPIMPAGMSTFNKLQTLRTDPALKVLKSQTWREFFTNANPGVHSSSPSPSNASRGRMASASSPALLQSHRFDGKTTAKNSNNLGNTTFSRSSNRSKEAFDKTNSGREVTILDLMFEQLQERIQNLWQELKIPNPERQFYKKTLLNSPVESIAQCRELADYVEHMQQHKEATKVVLRAISIREKALKKCYDVLIAVHRKYGTQALPETKNLRRSMSANKVVLLSQQLGMDQKQQVFWKEELIFSLDEVRCASLEVIKCIQQWRRTMWRPHPFNWRGINYLLKMKQDMAVLQTDSYVQTLALVPLHLHDLQCIVFLSQESFGNSRLSKGYRDDTTIQDQEREVEGETSGYIKGLINEFCNNIDFDELEAAASIVKQEENLEQAILSERTALTSKGVFIPLLRSSKMVPGFGQSLRGAQQLDSTQISTAHESVNAHNGAGNSVKFREPQEQSLPPAHHQTNKQLSSTETDDYQDDFN